MFVLKSIIAPQCTNLVQIGNYVAQEVGNQTFFKTVVTNLLVIFLLCTPGVYAQSVNEVRSNISTYVYGEGEGATLFSADDAALVDLLRKISVTVKGVFIANEKEQTSNQNFTSETLYESKIKTYTNATLTNTDRIIIKQEPNARVLRFVRRSEIDRIFDSRKNKIDEFIEIAENALSKRQIDDALRYYYWAFLLTNSLLYPNEFKRFIDNEDRLLVSYLPIKIENILRNIELTAAANGNDCYSLRATYEGSPIRSMDYSYFDGRDNSAIFSIQDGFGSIEMSSGLSAKSVDVKVEYEFSGLTVTDREMENIMKSQEPSIFRKAYIPVALPVSTTSERLVASSEKSTSSTLTTDVGVDNQYSIIKKIHDGILNSRTSSLKNLFDENGWQEFTKILSYGQISTSADQKFDFFKEGDETICRGLSCRFRFTTNRVFNEQLSFVFGRSGKICHVALGLGKQMAEEDILSHCSWGIDSRKKIISFLEDYRTAYALKDIGFMERVFDDNAVIIVGRKLQVAPIKTDMSYQQNKFVKLTKYKKDEFIKHLRSSFASKSYINLHFSNCEIIQLQKGVERYGIQIKQDYYSSNYGDTGYLYLLVDLTDPKNPIIHVRTWQETPDPDFGVIGPGHF